jgi:thiamine kinase-like enzyme
MASTTLDEKRLVLIDSMILQRRPLTWFTWLTWMSSMSSMSPSVVTSEYSCVKADDITKENPLVIRAALIG